ncbi:43375_t:CDS:2, partial [Gigaspora margarita]
LLKQRITELEAENIELKHENTKLKQIIEENVEFKAKIIKLEQAVDKIEKRDQSISRTFSITKDNDSLTNSSLPVISQLSTPPPIEDHPDKDYSVSVNTSQLKAEPASLEDKEIDKFLDSKYKKKVSEEIIQSIKEKKLREQDLSLVNQMKSEKMIPQSCDVKTVTNCHNQNYVLDNSDTISIEISESDNQINNSEVSESTYLDNLPKAEISAKSSSEAQVMASNKNRLYQYAIEHGINPKEFSIIIEVEKNRWTTGCFCGDLERDICFYRGGIERKEDPRKYRKLLTDRKRLVGEELLRRSILRSGLSTAWLDNLIEEWEKTYNQFIQIFN